MKANENKKFLRYNFYQKALKLGKKYYFLLDFFYGLKGFFLYKEKIIKKKKLFVYAKSFNKFFFVPRIKKNKFDYFLNSSYNLNYSNEFYKKKGNIFLSALIKKKLVYSSNLTNLWLLQYFLDLKKVYTQLLCLKLFNNFNYLNIYYNFIKHNYIIKNFIFLKKYFVWKLSFLNERFILFNYVYNISQYILNFSFKSANLFLYNQYNNFKNLKILFLNRLFKKSSKYFNNFEIYNNKELLKFCFIKQKKRINFGKFSFLNKSFFFSKNKRKNLIFKENELILKHKGLLIRSIFYFKFFGYIYIKHYLNCKNKNNILLKYYFYFYDFIIKIFIKLLNNFKFIILNKALKGNLVKNFIWFKIAIIFLYYKKIIINKMSNKLIRNFNLKATLAKFSKSENKLNFFLKNSSEFQKKIANEKLGLFKEDLDLRLDLVKKIKHYKKSSNSYYFFRLKVLQKIYSSLDEKINEFKKQKENGSLKLNKLYKFIKNSKLKKQVILKELAIVNTK